MDPLLPSTALRRFLHEGAESLPDGFLWELFFPLFADWLLHEPVQDRVEWFLGWGCVNDRRTVRCHVMSIFPLFNQVPSRGMCLRSSGLGGVFSRSRRVFSLFTSAEG